MGKIGLNIETKFTGNDLYFGMETGVLMVLCVFLLYFVGIALGDESNDAFTAGTGDKTEFGEAKPVR